LKTKKERETKKEGNKMQGKMKLELRQASLFLLLPCHRGENKSR
jgi:hypothetical protein